MITPRRFYVFAPIAGTSKWCASAHKRTCGWFGATVLDTEIEARKWCQRMNRKAQAELRNKKARPAPKSAPKEAEEAQKHLTTPQGQNAQSSTSPVA